jgi:hypothetical protein
MTPGLLNLSIRQGDTFTQLLTIANADPSDPSGHTPGTPVDLTGCAAEMKIVAAYDVVAAYSLNSSSATANGGTLILGGENGTVAISIPAADTLNLANGRYDLKIRFADGSIHTFIAGSVLIEAEVTEWTQ